MIAVSCPDRGMQKGVWWEAKPGWLSVKVSGVSKSVHQPLEVSCDTLSRQGFVTIVQLKIASQNFRAECLVQRLCCVR